MHSWAKVKAVCHQGVLAMLCQWPNVYQLSANVYMWKLKQSHPSGNEKNSLPGSLDYQCQIAPWWHATITLLLEFHITQIIR